MSTGRPMIELDGVWGKRIAAAGGRQALADILGVGHVSVWKYIHNKCRMSPKIKAKMKKFDAEHGIDNAVIGAFGKPEIKKTCPHCGEPIGD